MRPVAILGAGGHAHVVANVLRLLGRPILGMYGLGEELPEAPKVNGIGGRRREIADKYGEFEDVWHPSAIIPAHWDDNESLRLTLMIGTGTQIMAGAVIQPGVTLGHNVLINTSASVDHDCVIEDHVHIAPGARLCGGVTVMEGAFIGAGAIICPGQVIGPNAFIKAGSVIG